MTTVIYGDRETEIGGGTTDGDDLWLPLSDLTGATGWECKPEGLCAGDRCVPVPPGREDDWQQADRFNLSAFARHLDQPVVSDRDHGVWVFGEEPVDRSGPGGEAPDFTLPDLDGAMHSLSDYRGKKVVLHAWASW